MGVGAVSSFPLSGPWVIKTGNIDLKCKSFLQEPDKEGAWGCRLWLAGLHMKGVLARSPCYRWELASSGRGSLFWVSKAPRQQSIIKYKKLKTWLIYINSVFWSKSKRDSFLLWSKKIDNSRDIFYSPVVRTIVNQVWWSSVVSVWQVGSVWYGSIEDSFLKWWVTDSVLWCLNWVQRDS